MNISATNSPSFGKLKVNTSNMSYWQIGLSDQLDRKLKNSNSYASFEDEPIDVYILPKKDSSEKLEIRYAEPYSGNFYKEDKKIIKQEYNGSDPFGMADKITETLGRISRGEIKKPKYNYENFQNGKTDIFRIRPELYEKFIDEKNYWESNGYDTDEAFYEASEWFENDYVKHNVDENF